MKRKRGRQGLEIANQGGQPGRGGLNRLLTEKSKGNTHKDL